MSGSHFFSTLFQASLRNRSSRLAATITEIQKRRLKQLLEVALRRVPFHAQRIGGRSVEQFDQIPVSCKESMQQDLEQTLNTHQLKNMGIESNELLDHTFASNSQIHWYKGKVLLSRTSGTSGMSGAIFNTRKTWAMQRAVIFSRMRQAAIPWSRFNPRNPFRMAYLVVPDVQSVSFQAAEDASKSNSCFARIRTFSIEGNWDSVLEDIVDFDPHYLHSYPSCLDRIASLKIAGNLPNLSPQVISSGSSLWTVSQQDRVANAFPNSRFANHYGATECLPIANSCSEGKLHLNSDYVLIEPVDRDDRLVEPGERGNHVLLTNLINHFQPIIRYRLDDSLRVDPSNCCCGSHLPTLDVKGRSFPRLSVDDRAGKETAIEGVILFSKLLGIPEIAEFQIHYQTRNLIEIRLRLEKCIEEERTIRINDCLVGIQRNLLQVAIDQNCEGSVQVKILRVNEFPLNRMEYKRKIFNVKPSLIAE